jgi:hypothetical protein
VINHLQDGLRTKCFHLWWVPHTLAEAHKAAKISCAQETIRILDNQARTQFKYLLTGDESWMHHDQSPTKIWALDQEFVGQQVHSTNSRRKTMIIVFLGVEGIALLTVLPRAWKVTSAYFQEHSLRELAVQKYSRGRKSRTPH